LGQRVTKLLGFWKRGAVPVKLNREQMSGIQLALSPAFRLLPVLFRQIAEQEERLVRLTEDQIRLLEFLGAHDRAVIRGVAGSGKTILAIAQAQKFARGGKKTLFVCFNRSLAEWLQEDRPSEFKDTIKIDTFHGICSEFCRKARIPFSPQWNDGGEFWRTTAPELLLSALEVIPDRFDAVVVDEGQDFYPDWWIGLEMINSGGENGPFYVFFDPAQNLFVDEDLAIPDLGHPVNLHTNCRNSRCIALTCSKIRGVDVPIRGDAPEGTETVIRYASQPESQARAVQKYVKDWIDKGRLRPSQIAILSPFDKSKSCLAAVSRLGKTRICTNLCEWQADHGVLVATIRSFKGLEADVIIVTDVPDPKSSSYFSVADLYVACSRAKHMLVVLMAEKGVL